MKNLFIFRAFFHAPRLKPAFSLVEMLMALLVASLLLAALAPVITRRVNENMHITGSFSHEGKSKTVEIAYRDPQYCPNVVYDDNGNELYCEGEYTVPEGFQNITVTAIGAGGGGGTAPAAGYIEYTQAGSTNTFTVPLMTDKLEATLISGGAGGGAGGISVINTDYVKSQDTSWTIPDIARGKQVLITACGGGGGGGGGLAFWCNGGTVACEGGGGGGSGGYVANVPFAVSDDTSVKSIAIRIGGQGGRGSHGHQEQPFSGGFSECGLGGGAGGADYITSVSQISTNCGGDLGGSGGSSRDTAIGLRIAATGGCINFPCTTRAGAGTYYLGTKNEAVRRITGGAGSNGGQGGDSVFYPESYMQASSGAGGGYFGGGGGGATSSGGGGGGGGPTIFNGLIYASGGGGGASAAASNSGDIINISGAGGGGGGGLYGGKGGNGGMPVASNYYGGGGGPGEGGGGGHIIQTKTGVDGYGYIGGVISNSVFPAANCNGGNGAAKGERIGSAGGTGALRITYLDYGPGGSGGGAGGIVPLQPIETMPGEKLTISIGEGGIGGSKGYINKISDTVGEIKEPTRGTQVTGDKTGNFSTKIINSGNKQVLSTLSEGWTPTSGSPTGQIYTWAMPPYYSHPGGIIDGITPSANGMIADGFESEGGKSAGNQGTIGNIKYANKTVGGDGGRVKIFGNFTCEEGGKGGTASNPKGGDASGFGCGGGGGYGLADGGKGSGGYARLSWNMFWDTAKNAYVSKTSGSGGGGASGNIIKETIRAKEGQVIRIRIGAGGHGAKILNNSVVEAAAGGDTIFGSPEFIQIKAGGGGGGKSPAIKDGKLQKGAGGAVSALCHVGSRDLHKNSNYCTIGTAGGVSPDNDEGIANGGRGSAFSYKLNDKTYVGKAGTGGISSTQYNNAKGQDAEGIGAGGGGAALFTQNKVNSLGDLNYPQGGNGAPGRIILQLWE